MYTARRPLTTTALRPSPDGRPSRRPACLRRARRGAPHPQRRLPAGPPWGRDADLEPPWRTPPRGSPLRREQLGQAPRDPGRADRRPARRPPRAGPQRGLRQPVVGRKNWLFARTEVGGHAAASLYTLIGSCVLQGIDPSAYIFDALNRVRSHPANRMHELTPPELADRARGGSRRRGVAGRARRVRMSWPRGYTATATATVIPTGVFVTLSMVA